MTKEEQEILAYLNLSKRDRLILKIRNADQAPF